MIRGFESHATLKHRQAGAMSWALPLLLAISLLPASALAASCNFNVAGTAAFGIYDGAANNDTATTTISGDCSRSGPLDPDLVNPTITLSTGLNGAYSPWRQMALVSPANPAKRLSYNLYVDVARTTVWGDGTGSSSAVSAFTLQGNGRYINPNAVRAFTFTVYGRIPASTPVVNPSFDVGDYQDTITVTLNF